MLAGQRGVPSARGSARSTECSWVSEEHRVLVGQQGAPVLVVGEEHRVLMGQQGAPVLVVGEEHRVLA